MHCEQAIQEDRASRYVAGELAESERDAFEVHILDCAECARAVEVLAGLPAALAATTDSRAPRPSPWTPSRLPVLLAFAATLVVGLATGVALGRRSAPTAPADVIRSGPATLDALPVAAALDLAPDAESEARRAISLITCPAAAPGGAERLEATLAGPDGRVAWTLEDAEPVAGRVRVVVDLRTLEGGAWSLRLRRLDVAGRELASSACGFELR